MPPMTLERMAVQCCKSCAHVLHSDSSETHLRCGLGYYIQPPLLRKQGRMDSYPVVEAHERCGRWRDSLKGVLMRDSTLVRPSLSPRGPGQTRRH